jgi:hypothetical protein
MLSDAMKPSMLSVLILSNAIKLSMLSVIILNVIMLTVLASKT